ncbi:MAG: small multi-drug export protein [Treponemataceae bacterium]|nr:small multi-drug export protein [Treponemataceae bacterium]
MTFETLFFTGLLAILPISELRGSIPYAIAQGMSWPLAYLYSVGCNALVAPLCWLFLGTFHRILSHLSWYQYFFNRIIERARVKIHPQIEKWGWLGVAVFVAIPLPVTGAWTGTLGAWVLGLDKKKTLLSVTIGVALAGLIVTTVILLGLTAFSIFVKTL